MVSGRKSVKSYCVWSKSFVNVPRLSSSGIVACGLFVRSGFQGDSSILSGLTVKASWGLTMFWVRNAFPKLPVGFLYFDTACQSVSPQVPLPYRTLPYRTLALTSSTAGDSLRLINPVYSSREVSVFSNNESITSTTFLQLFSTSS